MLNHNVTFHLYIFTTVYRDELLYSYRIEIKKQKTKTNFVHQNYKNVFLYIFLNFISV